MTKSENNDKSKTTGPEPEAAPEAAEATQGAAKDAAASAAEAAEKSAAKDTAASAAGAAEKSAAEAAEKSAAEAAEEASALKDRLLRTLAEMENLRKRTRREIEEAGKYAIAGFAREVLAVADNLHRALENLPKPEGGENEERLKTITEGIAMTERELLAVFERHGIERIEPLGEKFDYNFHQAMFEVDNSGQPAGTVVTVVQPGYRIKERLLRPALVGVAKDAGAAPGQAVDTQA